jgi:glycosyltransferase involved in cell wall biosynthesis
VILVPAYRCEATIEETLKSIQQQGAALKRVEAVVIADDGSRDRTAEVARAVWHSAIPLRILERQFNCGEYSNVNRAVEEFPPEVEWFLIMHADNIAKPGWLSAFLSRIDAAGDDVALIGSSYDCFAESRPVRPGENGRIDQLVTVVGSQATMAGTLRMGCWWHI